MKNAFVNVHLWTLLGAGILYLIGYLLGIQDLNTFSIYAYLTFYVITILTMLVAYFTYAHPNKILFGNAVLAMMIFKLVVSPFLIIWYIKTGNEITKLILVPFFFSYLWFTGYELWYLLKKSQE